MRARWSRITALVPRISRYKSRSGRDVDGIVFTLIKDSLKFLTTRIFGAARAVPMTRIRLPDLYDGWFTSARIKRVKYAGWRNMPIGAQVLRLDNRAVVVIRMYDRACFHAKRDSNWRESLFVVWIIYKRQTIASLSSFSTLDKVDKGTHCKLKIAWDPCFLQVESWMNFQTIIERFFSLNKLFSHHWRRNYVLGMEILCNHKTRWSTDLAVTCAVTRVLDFYTTTKNYCSSIHPSITSDKTQRLNSSR